MCGFWLKAEEVRNVFWGKCLFRKLRLNCWPRALEHFYHPAMLWVNKARETNFIQLMFAVRLWPLPTGMTLNICYGKKKWYHFNFRLYPHLAREKRMNWYHPVLSLGLLIPPRTSPWDNLFGQGFWARIRRVGLRTRPVHVTQLRAIQHNLLRGCWALCFIRKQNISFPHH